MNKRNAAAAAAANGAGGAGTEDNDATPDNATGPSSFTLPSTTGSERLRNNPNPFADYEDEDNEDGSGSDDDVADVGGSRSDDATVNMGSWNRGSWWRGVVRSTRGKKSPFAQDTERFGDGRDDDSDDSDGGGRGGEEEDDIEDEEFGDFAMPEVAAAPGAGSGGGFVSGIDPAREKFLVKPLAVHPPSSTLKSSVSPFSSLWPFSSQGFGGSKEKSQEAVAGETGTAGEGGAGSAAVITEEPVELTSEEEAMISEDGKKIDRAVEAKRRTSIEDPDEDELGVGGEEIIVHKDAGVH